MKNLFIFIGPPGSGKGSLSQRCIQHLGWKQLSTGALCRKHIAQQTDIGKKIDFIIKQGQLIDDALIISMVQDWLMRHDEVDHIILDGFPRTLGQANALYALVKELRECILKVIHLVISDTAVLNRLTNRLICQNSDCQAVFSMISGSLEPKKTMVCDFCSMPLVRRQDDAAESIKERLKVYYQHEKSLVNFFGQIGQSVMVVDVEKRPEAVFNDFILLTTQKTSCP